MRLLITIWIYIFVVCVFLGFAYWFFSHREENDISQSPTNTPVTEKLRQSSNFQSLIWTQKPTIINKSRFKYVINTRLLQEKQFPRTELTIEPNKPLVIFIEDEPTNEKVRIRGEKNEVAIAYGAEVEEDQYSIYLYASGSGEESARGLSYGLVGGLYDIQNRNLSLTELADFVVKYTEENPEIMEVVTLQ